MDLIDYYQSKKATSQQYGQEYTRSSFQMFQPIRSGFDYMGQELELERERKVKEEAKRYYKNRTDLTRKGKDPTAYNYSDDDEVSVFPDPYIKYKIIPAEQEKMALDVTTIENDKLTKGNLIIWDYHGGPNQHFYFKRAFQGLDFFYIINASTGFVVEVPNGETHDSPLQMMPIDPNYNPKFGRSNQIWELKTCGKDLFTITSFCGKCMDVSNNWIRNGTKVIQYTNHNGKNQKWRIWPSWPSIFYLTFQHKIVAGSTLDFEGLYFIPVWLHQRTQILVLF